MWTWKANFQSIFNIIVFGEGDDVVKVIIIIDSTLHMINSERNYNTIFFMLQDRGGGARYNNAKRARNRWIELYKARLASSRYGIVVCSQ